LATEEEIDVSAGLFGFEGVFDFGINAAGLVNHEGILNSLLLAEDAKPAGDGLMGMMPALVIIMGLFYFLILRPQKNKEQTFRSMVDNLKEKDRIVTIGGIHGVVTNVQRESEIVTVRIDEASGTKIRIGTSAIARVVTDEETKK